MKNEENIITAVVNGIDNYAELVERYHVGLIIHCEKILNDRDDAEDIAQEAFIKAYTKLDTYDAQKARFSTWVYRIATNLCINHIKNAKRSVQVQEIEAIAEATMPTHLDDEQKKEVRTAVIALVPPNYRKVIEDYYWHGKSYQQIAVEVGVPVNTVRTWLRRAKDQMREKLS